MRPAEAEATPAERALAEAVDLARTGPEADRARNAHELNELLIAMRDLGDRSGNARAILRLLSGPELEGLEDERGRSCHAVAVQVIRDMGPPWSQQLSAGALAASEKHHGKRLSGDTVVVIAFIAVVVGLLVQIPFDSAQVERVGWRSYASIWVWLAVIASTAACIWAWVTFRKR